MPSYKGQSPQLNLRRYFADLIAIVSNRFRLCPPARHLAVYLLDLFMDRYDISVQQLHVVALSCLLLASKFEDKEDHVPKLEQLNSLGCMTNMNLVLTKQSLLHMELLLLETFQWNLYLPTAAHFIDYYLSIAVHETDLHEGWPMACLEKTRLYMAKYADYFLEVSLQVLLSVKRFTRPLVFSVALFAIAGKQTTDTQRHLRDTEQHYTRKKIQNKTGHLAHDNDVKEANKQKCQQPSPQSGQTVYQTHTQLNAPPQIQQHVSQYLHQQQLPYSQQNCQPILTTGHMPSYTIRSHPSSLQASIHPHGHVQAVAGMTLQNSLDVKVNAPYNKGFQVNGHYTCAAPCFDRLDRLFILLDTGTTPVTRKAAAQQLGDVVKLHPHELNNLLSKVLTYLRSPNWDTRIAAGQAVEAIVKNVPEWNPVPKPKQESSLDSSMEEAPSDRLSFYRFDVSQLLKHGSSLLGSAGVEFEIQDDSSGEADPKERLARQRKLLQKKLGLDMGAAIGMNTEDLFNDEDLDYTPSKSPAANKQPVESSLDSSMEEAPSDRLSFYRFDVSQLLKHGSSLLGSAGVEFEIQDDSSGEADPKERLARQRKLLQKKLGLDMGAAIGMNTEDLFNDEDLDYTPSKSPAANKQPTMPAAELIDSEFRPGMSNRQKNKAKRMAKLVAKQRSRDVDSNEKSNDSFDGEPEEKRRKTTNVVIEQPATDSKVLIDNVPDSSNLFEMTHFSFLHVSLEKMEQQHQEWLEDLVIRLLCIFALDRFGDFVSDEDLIGALLPKVLPAVTEGLQDLDDDVRAVASAALIPVVDSLVHLQAIKVWTELIRQAPLQYVVAAACPWMGAWLCLMMQPSRMPIDLNMLLEVKAKSKEKTCGKLRQGPNQVKEVIQEYIAGADTISEDPATRDYFVMRARMMAAKLLGALCHCICDPEVNALSQEIKPSESLAQLLLFHLNSKSALQRIAVALVLCEWAVLHKDCKAVSSAVQPRLLAILSEHLYYDEIAIPFTRMQNECKQLMALLAEANIDISNRVNCSVFTIDQANELVTTIFSESTAAINLKSKPFEQLDSKRQQVQMTVMETNQEWQMLHLRVHMFTACAIVNLQLLPDKLNPVIKPLMEAVKKEDNTLVQSYAATFIARLLQQCIPRTPCPNPKILKNLCSSAGIPNPPNMSEDLIQQKAKERHFLEQLLDGRKLENYKIPVPIKAELRKYQQDGVNWLSFLNKYKLHGILCDDMGLGKTLQSICILAGDYYLRAQEYTKSKAANCSPLPSLVVCPPTLTGHWVDEVGKFCSREYLNPLHYTGPPTERARLQHQVKKHNLVVASYDVVRNDIDFFRNIQFNYCILDEGHVIKNGKTKLSKAVKQLAANYRIILSGTPIQNNVLELWSLFDYLMPGFLGTERQFAARYGKPILASRDARSSSREQEAGVLAMEALHRQVLPFLLRRMKEDVLQDLPPKIIQDYYCNLSPLQISFCLVLMAEV
ncbi:UNVERIFIED_CONTAM: hypothetical protein FKN15_033634 [Acipenser sinensis]